MAVLLAALAVALVGAGCGGDDDSTTTAAEGEETLTRVEFIKQGDEICEKGEQRSEDEAEAFAEENGFELENASEEQVEEAVTEVLVPVLREQADEIRALGIPEGDEEQVDEILAALEEAADEVEEDPSQALEGTPLKKASELAEDYGFKVCGEE